MELKYPYNHLFMPPTEHIPFSEPSTREKNISQFKIGLKEHIKNTPAALMLATVMLVGSALDNNAHGAENTFGPPTTATTKSLANEKQLPQIAEENPQIYEFLDGKINRNDTLLTLQKKLGRKIQGLLDSVKNSDEFSYYLGAESAYRQKTNKPASALLNQAAKQIENEQTAAKNLDTFFRTLQTKDIGTMNDALITYYNAVGGNIWGKKDLEQWKNELEKERKGLNYSFQETVKWIAKNEK